MGSANLSWVGAESSDGEGRGPRSAEPGADLAIEDIQAIAAARTTAGGYPPNSASGSHLHGSAADGPTGRSTVGPTDGLAVGPTDGSTKGSMEGPAGARPAGTP